MAACLSRLPSPFLRPAAQTDPPFWRRPPHRAFLHPPNFLSERRTGSSAWKRPRSGSGGTPRPALWIPTRYLWRPWPRPTTATPWTPPTPPPMTPTLLLLPSAAGSGRSLSAEAAAARRRRRRRRLPTRPTRPTTTRRLPSATTGATAGRWSPAGSAAVRGQSWAPPGWPPPPLPGSAPTWCSRRVRLAAASAPAAPAATAVASRDPSSSFRRIRTGSGCTAIIDRARCGPPAARMYETAECAGRGSSDWWRWCRSPGCRAEDPRPGKSKQASVVVVPMSRRALSVASSNVSCARREGCPARMRRMCLVPCCCGRPRDSKCLLRDCWPQTVLKHAFGSLSQAGAISLVPCLTCVVCACFGPRLWLYFYVVLTVFRGWEERRTVLVKVEA